MTYKIEK